MSLFPKNLSEYAALALSEVPRSKGSKVFIVDPVNGSDSNPGTNFSAPLLTLEAAYALCTTLKNDTVLVVGNGTVNALAAAVTWAKSYTHLVGLCAPGQLQPGVTVQPTAALATTPLFNITGDGCVFKNIKWNHATTDVLGLVNVYMTGDNNTFVNCQFAGGAGSNNLTGMRHLKISAAHGNTFDHCTIGQLDILQVDGGAGVEILADSAYNTWKDCAFVVNLTTGNTTFPHVLIAAAASIGPLNRFVRCQFYNTGAGVQAEAFTIGAALAAAERPFVLDSWLYGATEWETTNNGLVTNVTIAANTTGVATGNIMKITS